MSEVTLEQVSQKAKDLFNRGFTAMERGNLDYAIDMFSACLEMEPCFHRARKFLRAAEVKQFKGKGGGQLSHWMAAASGMPTYLTAMSHLKSNKPTQAIQTIEKVLRKDPLNLAYLKLLAQAAEAAGEFELAIHTLINARESNPQDPQIVNWLGILYMRTNQPKLGRECFEILCQLKPNDAAALKALKDAMAIDSMNKDGWAEAASSGGSFRRMIKDEKEATILEQESKAVKGQKDIDALIGENIARIEREPGNINYRRALASLYATNNMYEQAIQTLEEAQSLSGGRDPQIDNALSQIRLKAIDYEIEQLREKGLTAVAENKARERAAFQFNDVQERVTRYPNDLQLRYEYGVLLYEQQRLNESIQQFQQAQRNPQRRVNALYYIGLCFKQKQQYDLAIEQFEKAATELPGMDDQKKAVLYELAQVLELTTDRSAEAHGYYKQIYQIDIGYKDVAAKVEGGYQKKPASA